MAGLETVGTNWSIAGSLWTSGKNVLLQGGLSTVTIFSGKLWSLPPWKYWKAGWTWSWTRSRWPCLNMVVRHDGLQRSFSPHPLCGCDLPQVHLKDILLHSVHLDLYLLGSQLITKVKNNAHIGQSSYRLAIQGPNSVFHIYSIYSFHTFIFHLHYIWSERVKYYLI